MKSKDGNQKPNKKTKQRNEYSIFSIAWLGFEIAIVGAIIGNFIGGLEGACITGVLAGVLGVSIGVITKQRSR